MDAPAGRRRSLPFILVGLVVLGYLALGVSEAWTDAPTFDEPVYVSSGLAALLQHDLVVNDEHPPLDKALAALPVLLVHPMMPRAHSGPTNDERAYSAWFVTLQTAAGSLRRVTFVSRLVPLAESIGIALVLFALASELFGTGAGALAAVLWLASPLVLGIGHLDGTDIPFTLAVVLNSWALTRWFRHGSRAALVAVGLAGALLASTQSTGILLVGLDVAVVAFTSRALGLRRSLTRCALVALLVWLGVWLPYLVLDPATLTHGISIVPRPYLEGISYLAGHDTVAAPGYLLGHAYTGGRWWFWPLSMAIKLPIALLALLVAGAASWRVLERKGRLVAARGPSRAGRHPHRLHVVPAPRPRCALPASGPGPRVRSQWGPGARGVQSADQIPPPTGSPHHDPGRGQRGRHGRLVSGLPGLDLGPVPTCLLNRDGLRCRLGAGSLPTRIMGERTASVGRVLRSPRCAHRRGGTTARGCVTGWGDRVGGGVGHRPHGDATWLVGLAAKLLPRRRPGRLDTGVPLRPAATGDGPGTGITTGTLPRWCNGLGTERSPLVVGLT